MNSNGLDLEHVWIKVYKFGYHESQLTLAVWATTPVCSISLCISFYIFETWLQYICEPIYKTILVMASIEILIVFTTKTRGEGSGQVLTILWFSNQGPANY